MRETTFTRKLLRLKAHKVTWVEESETSVVIHIDRFGKRLLRCGLCRHLSRLRAASAARRNVITLLGYEP